MESGIDSDTSMKSNLTSVQQFTDTVLVSRDTEDKEFKLYLDDHLIDLENSHKLDGEWMVINGKLNFLITDLKSGDKVIFSNKTSKTMSGWGILTYNRIAKFYFTKYGSHSYEYYIDKEGFLNLIEFEYRNDDLTFKESPETVIQQITIKWKNSKQIQLIVNNKKAELKKVTTANNI